MRILACLLPLATLLTGTAAADLPVYDQCIDSDGRAVAVEMNVASAKVVETVIDQGHPVIRYNPELLPGLSAKARTFLFARECGRLSLDRRLDRPETPAQARRADCLGVAAMIASGLLGEAEGGRELQSELVFAEADWERLPGPQRRFDLASCPARSALKLPPPGLPSAQQAKWNGCVRACADPLRRCQDGCGGGKCVDGCVAVYERCEAGCRGE